jgi:inner membrane protein
VDGESSWPHPSFGGDFLPQERVSANGFQAQLSHRQSRAGPIARLDGRRRAGQRIRSHGPGAALRRCPTSAARRRARPQTASINLIQPVDLYSRVNRATKYGFLFIGFTFLALLMFDVIGGVRVSAVEYLLMGAAIVLFFVLLLAFAR